MGMETTAGREKRDNIHQQQQKNMKNETKKIKLKKTTIKLKRKKEKKIIKKY